VTHFTGKERDAESGLDNFGARYDASSLGRFMSADPLVIQSLKARAFQAHLSNPQSWNKYAYVMNNPLNAIDPNGLDTYVVLYTTGNSYSEDQIRRAAETKAKEIENSKGFDPKKDKVLLQGVKTIDDLKNALKAGNAATKQFGPVRELALFGHSGQEGPTFHGGPITALSPHGGVQLTPSEINGLPQVNWAKGASAEFFGCNTANFASEFAGAEHVNSFGTASGAYFFSNPSYLEPDRGGNLWEGTFRFPSFCSRLIQSD
jgi:RHS repeat-associated protein